MSKELEAFYYLMNIYGLRGNGYEKYQLVENALKSSLGEGKYCLMIDGIIDNATSVFNNEDPNYEHMIWKRSDDVEELKRIRERYMKFIKDRWLDAYLYNGDVLKD